MARAAPVSAPFVTCPECGAYFELTDALVAPIRAQLAEENEAAMLAAREVIRQEEAELARTGLAVEQQDLRNQVQEKDALLVQVERGRALVAQEGPRHGGGSEGL